MGKETGQTADKEEDAAQKSTKLKDALERLQSGVKNTAAEFQNFSGGVLKTVGIGIAATIAGIGAAIAGMAKQVLTGFEGLARIQRITAQTEAVIESTGNAAGLTADEIVKMSDNLETLTATESESNQEAANMLLTFTSIGKDVFPRMR